MIYHIQINGGWRSVEFASAVPLPPWQSGTVIVRDRLRGTYHRVETSDLVPVVPRSQWEEEQDAK